MKWFGSAAKVQDLEARIRELENKVALQFKSTTSTTTNQAKQIMALAKYFNLEEVTEYPSSLFDPFGSFYYGHHDGETFLGWRLHVHSHVCTCGDKNCKSKKASK